MCEEILIGWNKQRPKREERSFDNALAQHETTQTDQSLKAASGEYNGFIAKHRDWPIAWTRQSGSNCGMYAAAMAIRSLLTARNGDKAVQTIRNGDRAVQTIRNGDKAVQIIGNSDKTVQTINDIAMALQAQVVAKKLSALGEMFNAKELEEAINQFFRTITSGTEKVHSAWTRYHAEAIPVNSEDKFKELLIECTKRGLRVLVPYLACGEQIKPGEFKVEGEKAKIIPLDGLGEPKDCGTVASDESDETVKAREMYNAHWCMVYDLEESGKVKLVEGNGSLLNATVKELFQSNASLVSEFDWRGYLIRYYDMDASKKTVEEVIAFLDDAIAMLDKRKAHMMKWHARIAEKDKRSEIIAKKIKARAERAEANKKELSAIRTYLSDKQSTSILANLSKQVIVIGRNSQTYDQKTAAEKKKEDDSERKSEETVVPGVTATASDPAAAAAAETDEDSE